MRKSHELVALFMAWFLDESRRKRFISVPLVPTVGNLKFQIRKRPRSDSESSQSCLMKIVFSFLLFEFSLK